VTPRLAVRSARLLCYSLQRPTSLSFTPKLLRPRDHTVHKRYEGTEVRKYFWKYLCTLVQKYFQYLRTHFEQQVDVASVHTVRVYIYEYNTSNK